MKKWADYFISKVSYDSEHLIYAAIRHQDTDKGITEGEPVDRLTISSDIKNGLLYITIYSGKDSWKKGHKIHTFSIGGTPYLRIDENKVKLDYLGDLPETSIEQPEPIKELEFQPEPEPTPEPPSSSRGSLPKGFTPKPTPQPEPEPTPEPEEATPEQLARLDNLQKQIDKLENTISPQDSLEATEHQTSRETEQIQQDEEKSKQQLLEEYEVEYLQRIEQEKVAQEKAYQEELEANTTQRLSQTQGSLPKGFTPKPTPQPEPEPTPEPPSSSRGSLPKGFTPKPTPQPEPEPTPEPEEATPEQLAQVDDLQKQIDELEDVLSAQVLPKTQPEPEEATPEQLAQVDDLQKQIDELEDVLSAQLKPSSGDPTPEQLSRVKKIEKEIEKLESIDIEHEIVRTLQKQNNKLDNIEKKLQNSTTKSESDFPQAYCVKCKTKRKIKNPKETTMKNGRAAIKGFCSVCNCKVFRIGKMKK